MRPNQAQQQPAPVRIIPRPNDTINLNADRTLRGIIGRGRMKRQLQGPVTNPPTESEDEDQAFVDAVA